MVGCRNPAFLETPPGSQDVGAAARTGARELAATTAAATILALAPARIGST
jgi:hypothetical protein